MGWNAGALVVLFGNGSSVRASRTQEGQHSEDAAIAAVRAGRAR